MNNLIILILFVILVLMIKQREQFHNMFIFDEYVYGYKVYCPKLALTFQKLINKSGSNDHRFRSCNKIKGVHFKSPYHYSLFIDALKGIKTFNDRVCLEYNYNPKENTSSSYDVQIYKSKITLNPYTFENHCTFYR
jgi:hypothetical protein